MSVKKVLIVAILLFAIASFYGFKTTFDEPDWFAYTNRCFAQAYDASGDPKLKKVELFLTPENFIRLRKTYAKDRQEYYSFNLHQLNDINYWGTASNGILEFKTQADDIIFQTYNDRSGDIDSMTTVLDIPVKNMEPERLDSLNQALNYFKAKGL